MASNNVYKYPNGTRLVNKFSGDSYMVVGHHGSFNIVRSVESLWGPGGAYELDCHIPMFYNVVEE